MDVDNSGKEIGDDNSVESDPKEADLQDDVGPDVGTSLSQQDKPKVEAAIVTNEENSNPDTDPVEDDVSKNSLENAHFGNETPKKATATRTKTLKSKIKTVGVGPKKGWSKVTVKSTASS